MTGVRAGAITGIYQGLLEALRWARGMGYVSVLVHGGDAAFVSQMLEGVRGQGDEVRRLWREAKGLERESHRVSYHLAARDGC